jgi:dTDP-4-amino-4,6-dideoxygalactose transaminase
VIPFVDLKAQYFSVKGEILEAVEKVLDSTQFVLGDEVATFESEFAAYSQASHAVALNTGTSALHLALLAAGVGPEDEVITVAFTFVATVAAICYIGAKPVFVDIDPVSFTMDVAQIEQAITPKTKVIMPVHLYGQTADMDPILEIAQRYGLKVIEDAAQAHGAEYKGRRVGSLGDIGCFSFYPGKNLGAYGEGGLVTTNNPDHAKTIRMLRDWGQERKYHHVLKGYNYRMDGIQGGILRVKLRYLDQWTEARRSHGAQYDQLLADSGVKTPTVMPYCDRHVYHIYTLRVAEREVVQQQLAERGVQTGIHYPIPVHLQPAYSDLGYSLGSLPQSEAAAREVLSLPMYAEMPEDHLKQAAAAVREVLHV